MLANVTERFVLGNSGKLLINPSETNSSEAQKLIIGFRKSLNHLLHYITWRLDHKKVETCTILIPKGNSYCRHKSSARGTRFKVSSEGISTEIEKVIRSPIQVQT